MRLTRFWTQVALPAFVLLGSLLGLLLGSQLGTAQGLAQRPEPRLRGALTESARARLIGSRSPQALPADDQGPVSPGTVIPGITLVFKRSSEQQTALDALLTAQQDATSPQYHQWLTPDTFAARFGMADEDLGKVQAWLEAEGFHIDDIPPGRDRLTFSGTALKGQSAFGADLHHYLHDGDLHTAPAADLTVPAELAPVTAAVLHLSDFRPEPSIEVKTPTPQFTSGAAQAHYLTPKDIATMYDLNGAYKNGFNGQGQSLAVVGQSYIPFGSGLSTAVETFSSNSTLHFQTPLPVLVPGSGVQATSPGDEAESELDLEYSAGIVTGARVFLVYVGGNRNYNVFDAMTYAITENLFPLTRWECLKSGRTLHHQQQRVLRCQCDLQHHRAGHCRRPHSHGDLLRRRHPLPVHSHAACSGGQHCSRGHLLLVCAGSFSFQQRERKHPGHGDACERLHRPDLLVFDA